MFFAQVAYDSIENKIIEIKSFKSGHLLERYSNLDGINDSQILLSNLFIFSNTIKTPSLLKVYIQIELYLIN